MHNVTLFVATTTNSGSIFQQPHSLYLGVNKISEDTDTGLDTDDEPSSYQVRKYTGY